MINILDKFSEVKDYFSPKIIGELNDTYIKIAKIKGDKIPWHNHEDEDEMFYVINGSLKFEIEGEDSFMLNKNEMYIVKRGINHKVSAVEECMILLVENKSTAHTGKVKSKITKSIEDQLI